MTKRRTKEEYRHELIEKRRRIKEELDALMGNEVTTPTQDEMERYDEYQRQIKNINEILNTFLPEGDKKKDENTLWSGPYIERILVM